MKNVVRLFFVLFLNAAIAQQPNDCVNALTVCGNGTFYSNASGIGNVQEVNACGGAEHNSLWLEIHIVQGGTLGFDLIPDDPDILVDYDFWIFGPNAVCGALGSPVRCATTNPQQAGLTSNLTGMNGSSLITQTGPGANGNGYVRWLNVTPGQSYYVVIDRPAGDGGFQLQWTGTATAGTGAFPSAPSANAIADVLTCSNTTNIGIFDLNNTKAAINPDTGNTISFHNTIADANDGINALPNIYANTSNPETIYVRVTDDVTGCYSITDFDLVVNLVPSASIGISDTAICAGNPVSVTFTGTPNAIIAYQADGGPVQTASLDASGTFSFTESPAATTTYTLTGVRIIDGSGNTVCSQTYNQAVSVTVNPLPTAAMSGTATICSGTQATVTFSGTPNATVIYTVGSGPNQSIVLDATGTAILAQVLTADTTYNLVSVVSATIPACSQTQSGSVSITVSPLPTAAISGSDSICSGSSSVITFSGTPNATVTYTVNGGSDQTIILDAAGSAILNTGPLTANAFYALVSASFSASCTQSLSGSATVSISAPPVCTISGTATICSGTAALISFLGTPGATVIYTANGGLNQTIVLDAAGTASLTPTPTVNTTYNLVAATLGGSPVCSQSLSGSAEITVIALPVATILGTATICSGSTAAIAFTGTPNATVIYTINGSSNQAVLLDGSGSASLTTPVLTTNTTYTLVSVSLPGSPACSRTLSGSASVTVNPIPVITNPPVNRSVCSGDLVVTNPTVSAPSGANINWTNSAPQIGLPASGVGNLPAFTAVNTGVLAVTGTINLTAEMNGCSISVSYTITVNPTPAANLPIADYRLCDANAPADEEQFDLSVMIPEITGLSGATVTFYDNAADAQNPLTATPLPAFYTNTSNPQQIWFNVRNSSGCDAVGSFDLVVEDLPVAVTPPTLFTCSNGSVLSAQFNLTVNEATVTGNAPGMSVNYYHNLADAQNGDVSLSIADPAAYTGSDNEMVFIRVQNGATGCFAITAQLLRVTQGPVAITPAPLRYCDPNNDGFGQFDLAGIVDQIAGGTLPPEVSVSFHETSGDADSGANAIPLTGLYTNIDPWSQPLFVRVFYTLTGCTNHVQVELIVDATPTAPVGLNNIVACDDDSDPQSQSVFVDLTQRTSDILAQQPLAAANYSVTYHLNQSDAESATAPITPANHYFGTHLQQIWVRVENIASHCYAVGAFGLEIYAPLALVTPTPLNECDDDAIPNNQFHEFDLTLKNNEINQGTGFAVTYYPTLALAQAGLAGTEINPATAYMNSPANPGVQTLGVVVTNPAGCKSITTLDIRVLPIPTPRANPPALAPKCDYNLPGDMLEYFDLTANETFIRNGDPALSFHYYLTQADASVPQNEIAAPTNALVGSNVWIRVENNMSDYQGNHCYVLIEQPLTVYPLPTVVQPIDPYKACDDNTDGIAAFDLSNPQLTAEILGTSQSPADFTVSYYLTAAGADPQTNTGELPLPSSYANVTAGSQNIFIRILNNATGCANATGALELVVEQYATATGPQVFSDCDTYNDPGDGVYQIDLTQFAPAILNGQSPAVFLVSYYTSQANAIAGINALSLDQAQAYETHPDSETIWVKVENGGNSLTPLCYAITTIEIAIERAPDPVIGTANGANTICVDFNTDVVVRPLTLNAGIANPSNYTFEWLESGSAAVIGTGPAYTVNTAAPGGATRSYTVRATSNSALGCTATSASFDVFQSGVAVIPASGDGYTVSNAFSDSQIITVEVQGYGTYEFSLDDGPRQASNVFENVSPGLHDVHVWDVEGDFAFSCGELVIENIRVIDYPHYFTPNGDGIHDTWNIVGLEDQIGSTIHIFDRYGKFLKQISPQGQGWDGTYNGQMLPSTDYWFTVTFTEENAVREFRAHFALKR